MINNPNLVINSVGASSETTWKIKKKEEEKKAHKTEKEGKENWSGKIRVEENDNQEIYANERDFPIPTSRRRCHRLPVSSFRFHSAAGCC